MGLFKRVFGTGDEASDKRVEKEIEKIESGEIDKIYPVLKPGDWVGIQAGAIKQTLFGTQEEPYLVTAFAYDAPSNFVFLMPKDIEGKDPQQILQEAYKNLDAVESNFEFVSALENKVLTASGHSFSSEKILSKNHMIKAHELLDADELLVSIPRRTCMMVISRKETEELTNMFLHLHNATWEDDSYGNAPILNALFTVVDGEITGIIPLEEE